MSLEIKGRPCDFCPAECRFMSLSVDSVPMFADNKAEMILNTVRCENENVCKMWADRETFIKEPGKEAEWLILTQNDFDTLETKISIRCSSCGHMQQLATTKEFPSLLAICPSELDLPKTCPNCLSHMVEIERRK